MGLGSRTAKISIFLGLFSQWTMAAAIYHLPPLAGDVEDLARPKQAFPKVERVFRVLNLSLGAPFSSYNTEFVLRNGTFKRIHSRFVNHVLEMIVERTTENLICQRNLKAGVVTRELMPGQAWRERTIGPIDLQALHEMGARRYLNQEGIAAYGASTHLEDSDRMIYLESLSWLSARQVVDLFGGRIPWARISEVEAPEGLGSREIRTLAEAGASHVRLRVRRATLRLVAAHVLHLNRKRELTIYSDPLPYEIEYESQGIPIPRDEGEIFYRFELGRAAQIPGLEGEALDLSALAGLVMWHHTMTYQDISTTRKSDVRAVDAIVYLHALDKSRQDLFVSRLGARVHVIGKKANDVVDRVSLRELLARTLPVVGLNSRTLGEIAIQADSMDAMRLDLDWNRGGELMNHYHPITIRLSRGMATYALGHFARDVTDEALKAKWVSASLEIYDQISEYRFPETRTIDPYDHVKHSRISADYFVSGLDAWTATNSSYVPAFLAALARFFHGVAQNISIAVVVAQTPGGDRELLHQLIRRGFELVPIGHDNVDFYNGPFVVRMTVGRLMDLAAHDPEITREISVGKPELFSGTWRAVRDINLLPGL